MRKKHMAIYKTLAAVLSLTLLTGCSQVFESASQPIKAGQTISSDSKWINSDIDGAVDKDTLVSLKDDFHTAVNKEWLLETELDSENMDISNATKAGKILRNRKLAIVKELRTTKEASFESTVEIDPGLLKHDCELVQKFSELAGNWEKRNELGVEPARPYIEAIEEIQNMDDMTDYLLNRSGMNYTGISPIEIGVQKSLSGEAKYEVMITPVYPAEELCLANQDEYSSFSDKGEVYKQTTDGQVWYLLGRLGYSEKEISRILKLCYRFEGRLAELMKSSSQQNDYINYVETADNHYDYEQLLELSPVFPMKELLERYQISDLEDYTVWEPDYIKGVQKLYQSKYLKEIKSYYVVQTVKQLLPLLDRESYDKAVEIEKQLSSRNSNNNNKLPLPTADMEEEQLTEEDEILLEYYFGQYLSGPFDQIYISKYSTREQKEEILEIVNQAVDYYRQMLLEEEWLSEEAREAAVEKLENISIRAVYPNQFKDYRGLEFEAYEENGIATGATLVEAVAAINDFQADRSMEKFGQPYDRDWWDLDVLSATVVNAFYIPTENSINILPGFLCISDFYDASASEEENMGRIGVIIGHEITHAFDSTGCLFDKDGRGGFWYSPKDVVKFQMRVNELGKYYTNIIPYPGATFYNGNLVSSEAVADMGGVKCMLGVAKQKENFDYELFFKSYASLWRCKRVFEYEQIYATDVHPLNFLRTNVTLQQFDEFMETFDIQPGDGMYLEPEKRTIVW